MKKIYIIPSIMVGSSRIDTEIMSGSRQISGGPTKTGDGIDLPDVVGETDGDLDPYDGHGQDGNSNRAPERWGDLW